jgi:hypothetical protein
MSDRSAQPDPLTDADAAASLYPQIVAAHVQGEPIDPDKLDCVLRLMRIDRATFGKDAADLRLAAELEREASTYAQHCTRLYAAQRAGDKDAYRAAQFDRGNASLASRRLDEVKRGNRRVFR